MEPLLTFTRNGRSTKYYAGIKLLNICYMKHSMSQKYLQRHIVTNIFENVIISILIILTASGMVLLLYIKHSQEIQKNNVQ